MDFDPGDEEDRQTRGHFWQVSEEERGEQQNGDSSIVVTSESAVQRSE